MAAEDEGIPEETTIDSTRLAEGAVSSQQVENELGLAESLLSRATSTDEYLEAIVRNQRAGLLQSGVSNVFGPRTGQDIPPGVLGTALEALNEQQTGEVLFNISGTERVYVMRATEDIAGGRTVRVTPDGEVELLDNELAAQGTTLSRYFSDEVSVNGNKFRNVEWDFRASTVTVVNLAADAGIDSTVEVRFGDPDIDVDNIEIAPDDRSLTFAGVNGVGASKLWFRSQDSTAGHEVKFIVVE